MEFRTVLFGGYNREQVHEYVERIEKDAEVSKFGYQSEIASLKEELRKVREEKNILEEALQKEGIEFGTERNESNLENENIKIYIEDLKKLKKENDELKQQVVDLEAEKFWLSENKKGLEKELEEIKNDIYAEKRNPLDDEIQCLRAEKEKYEDDFNAITKVLEDARLSAKYIKDEAQKNAEIILAQARKESKELIEYRKTQIDKELEDKGIRLMAAKYKIEAYYKEINSTQQKLYNLCTDMDRMIGGMPQRLEQLWEEDMYYTMIDEQNASEDQSENKVSSEKGTQE